MSQKSDNISTLHDGTLLQGGKYRIVRFISAGGFGCTYEGVHTMLGTRVAIKEFFVHDFCNRDETTSVVSVGTTAKAPLVAKLKDKFLDEAKFVFSLKHPHIVSVHDVFEENGTAYYVMDFIDGPSLADVVKARGPLPEDVVRRYATQLASALKYVHARNRLHLDIKPANVMVDGTDDSAILIDFGISKQYTEAEGENTSTLMGMSPGYASPEQMGRDVVRFHPATDIYALGATLYKMLTGNKPLSATLLASGEELDPLPSNVSDGMRRAIEASMQINKTRRPQTIEEFLDLMTHVAPEPMPDPDNEQTEILGEPVEDKVVDAKVLQNNSGVKSHNTSTRSTGNRSRRKKNNTTSTSRAAGPKGSVRALAFGICIVIGIIVITCIPRCGRQVELAKESDTAVKEYADTLEPAVAAAEPAFTDDTFTVDGVTFKMIAVEGGTFQMGATAEQENPESDETPVHSVTLSDYYIGETEVTQALWEAVMGSNPSTFKGADRPVENVSWDDCQTFIQKLNAETGRNFRLPTEAEWEFAARGGSNSRGYKYSGSNNLRGVAWFGQSDGHTYDNGNSSEQTHAVATKSPNELGLYDMSGNVWEWCQDYSGDYSSGSQTNPEGPSSGSYRVCRGGSWGNDAGYCRVSDRDSYFPSDSDNFLGLRLAL